MNHQDKKREEEIEVKKGNKPMNVFAWMQTRPDFSTTEQTIAQYLIENAHRAASLDAETIMRECYVSRAALYRFCSRCGFSGLRSLLLQMNADAAEWSENSDSLNFSYPFTERDDLSTIVSSLQKDYSQSILMTQSLIVPESLSKAAAAMRKASRILIFTSASNLPAAQSFRFQMAEINKTDFNSWLYWVFKEKTVYNEYRCVIINT